MKPRTFLLTLMASLVPTAAAVAYVGPGAGLSLLGALWALLAAVVTAIALVAFWPLRKMLRRRRAARAAADEPRTAGAASAMSKATHQDRSA